MSYPGSITHPTQGTFSFITNNFPGGWLYDIAMAQEVLILSPGVDGQRWRTEEQMHQDVVLTTFVDCVDYPTAVRLGRNYLQAKDGQPVKVAVTMAGNAYQWLNVHISGVVPLTYPGAVAGGTSGSLASLTCDWTLRIIDPGAAVG